MNLAGKVAVVTGGSRGLGRDLAGLIHQAGGEVTVCARSSEEANGAGPQERWYSRWHSMDHGEMVRIEVAPADIETVAKPGIREAIVDVCKAEGFGVVTLDLQGYGTR